MTARQTVALAVFGVALTALLASIRESSKVPLAALIVLSIVTLCSAAFLLDSFGKRPPLRAVGVFIIAIAIGLGGVTGYRTYQDNMIPSEVSNSRENVRDIQLALVRGDACTVEVNLDLNEPATTHRFWLRYGPMTRELLSEEIVDSDKRFRFFFRNGTVIALEELVENGRFLMYYYRYNGCLLATDHLDQNRVPLEMEYFSDCGTPARRIGPTSIWFWPKKDEPFKEPPARRSCPAVNSRDLQPPLPRPTFPVPTPGMGYR